MKIAIIGAAGKAGSRILKEASDRGHQVTAIVRHPEKVDKNIPYLQKDILELTRSDLEPFDVVVNAFSAPAGRGNIHIEAGRVLIRALSGTDTRLIVVGGAGSLYVDEAETVRLIDTPEFPKQFFEAASKQTKNLEELQQSENLNWTFLSPSAMFALGKRTGHYKTGHNRLLVNSDGKSYVSYEDYAAALVDEMEHPEHLNERFTVVSESE
ncbi:NAD(P)-dependent oxidoreductase [Sporolactobacillus pectinivorans]|uniref:NAD(P)-dependent oxidoreductase n=1 Tax=Sporolactobacillus pectinivorans TaxID=1591408 RepID=UPI000C257520|nr:NAD(P)-dependent oxidoreductase [Sporolactobacillus pectinivorans]